MTIIFPSEPNKQVRLLPFMPTNFPVSQSSPSDEKTILYTIKDSFASETTTNVLRRGKEGETRVYEPRQNEKTTDALRKNHKDIKSFFFRLKNFLDRGDKDRIKSILDGEGAFNSWGENLLNAENADNVYVFLRWFYPVAKGYYSSDGWSELTDEDWKNLEDIWNRMHPAPAEPARPAASESAPSPAPAPPEEQKTSGKEDNWSEYDIKKGDKLEKLAKERLPDGISIDQFVSEICATNNISNRNSIKSGQKILLPPKK